MKMIDAPALECVDLESGRSLAIVDATERAPLLLRGETVHRELRPDLDPDYVSQIERMIGEGARLVQLVEKGEVRAIALWRVSNGVQKGPPIGVEEGPPLRI